MKPHTGSWHGAMRRACGPLELGLIALGLGFVGLAFTGASSLAPGPQRESEGPSPRHRLFQENPAVSCGPVCLALVSELLGDPSPVEEFNCLADVSPTGVTTIYSLRTAL